jgi:hypothetical protein
MRAARKSNASVVFETLSQATGDRRPPGEAILALKPATFRYKQQIDVSRLPVMR